MENSIKEFVGLNSSPPGWSPSGLASVVVRGLYLHVPFCHSKCHYCDFYSIIGQDEARKEAFVDNVLAELDLWRDAGPTLVPHTLFFGGGTPTLLPAAAMERLLTELARRVDLAHVNEWTVEANPATVDTEYCRMLLDNGVNRISFGAQSFVERELAFLQRLHQPQQVAKSVAAARGAGFGRINLDLIYAIPGQTPATWEYSLDCALEMEPEHLSCYGLTYEPNTPLGVNLARKKFQAAPEQLELDLMRQTRQKLSAAGYEAYEISNYARPAEACRHNLLYWRGGDYIGLGPAAASHIAGNRWRNAPNLRQWERALAAGAVPRIDAEQLTTAQRAGELAMLELRLAEGIDRAQFAGQFGRDPVDWFAPQVRRLEKLQLLIVDERSIRLTEKALAVADAVAGEFL